MKYYAGIGSRQTPADVLALMSKIAAKLSKDGYVLRSGHAVGADQAFEAGSTSSEIYLPWPGFEGSTSKLCSISEAAYAMAAKFHPVWDMLSQGARKLHARNCYQILGYDLKTPVEFVVCWHNGSGGTMQAVKIASHYNIPVYNLNDAETLARLVAYVNK